MDEAPTRGLEGATLSTMEKPGAGIISFVLAKPLNIYSKKALSTSSVNLFLSTTSSVCQIRNVASFS